MVKEAVSWTVLAAILIAVFLSCTGREQQNPLYVLEEFVAASQVGDPSVRIERLEIFVTNHAAHPFRVFGYRRIFETLAIDVGDTDRAFAYVDRTLSGERDVRARGELLLSEFEFLWRSGRERGAESAADLLASSERYYRLFLIMGFYLMEDDHVHDLARQCFGRAADLARDEFERANALAQQGALLDQAGREEEALTLLRRATVNPFARRSLGRILWRRGKREEALEAYLSFVAVVPGARGELGLDSLYALVRPGTPKLDELLSARRIGDEGKLPDGRFVDIEGRVYRLLDYRGTNLVINTWSPT